MQIGTSSFRGTAMARPSVVANARSTRNTAPVRAAQSLQGKVVSTSTDKTTIVEVENISVHRLYNKRVTRTKRYTAHDEKGECGVGDVVILAPSRPLSKTKRFTVDEVVQKAAM